MAKKVKSKKEILKEIDTCLESIIAPIKYVESKNEDLIDVSQFKTIVCNAIDSQDLLDKALAHIKEAQRCIKECILLEDGMVIAK